MARRGHFLAQACATAAIFLLAGPVPAQTGAGSSVLPLGTELGEESFTRPREVFRSEAAGGRKSYLSALGDVAFNSPLVFGGAARQAGMSCNTCHISGTTNAHLFIPGLSTLPGNFDTTGHLFNPKADDGVLNPLTTPSLRGAHLLAPYGHDGRSPSLRDFVRNVVVNEFAGAEPSREILDALVVYIEDIDFVPNPRIGPAGQLIGAVSDEERRGERLFNKPFAHDPTMSCATCHVPSGGFVDHQQHDVGTGGRFKTPTLLNANFNAPYFHDGRYRNYAQAVVHFDRVFYLGLSARDRQDLVAYLQAVGDGEQANLADDLETHFREITDFASVLDIAIPEHNIAVIELSLDAIDRELREFAERFPDRKSSIVSGGVGERARARGALMDAVLSLRQVGMAAAGGHFSEATAALNAFRTTLAAATPSLQEALPWSLFNQEIHAAHYRAVRQLYRAAVDPALAPRRAPDND